MMILKKYLLITALLPVLTFADDKDDISSLKFSLENFSGNLFMCKARLNKFESEPTPFYQLRVHECYDKVKSLRKYVVSKRNLLSPRALEIAGNLPEKVDEVLADSKDIMQKLSIWTINHPISAGQRCDTLAADPDNKDNPKGTVIIKAEDVDAAQAIAACKKAIAESPKNLRYRHQLAGLYQRQEDRQIAKQYFTQLANAGYGASQLRLGKIYAEREHNYEVALKWFHKASAQGYAGADYYIGKLYDEGGCSHCEETREKLQAVARKYYLRAAKKGISPAEYALGTIYEFGHGVEVSHAEARRWYEKAGIGKYKDAVFRATFVRLKSLGLAPLNQHGFSPKERQLFVQFEVNSLEGDAMSNLFARAKSSATRPCDEIAARPNNPDNPKDIAGVSDEDLNDKVEEAIYLCRLAVRQYPDNLRSQYQLARTEYLFSNDEAIEQQALQRLEALAEQGYTAAKAAIGEIYLKNDNSEDGLIWLKEAMNEDDLHAMQVFFEHQNSSAEDQLLWLNPLALKGNINAMLAVADVYRQQKQTNKAIRWYRKAAVKGNIEAADALRDIYQNNPKKKLNLDKAIKWYKVANGKNHKQGREALGVLYFAKKDYEKSFDMLKYLPNDSTDKVALYVKSQLYLNGLGTEKSQSKGLLFSKKAAYAGHAKACFDMGNRYIRGNGVPKSYRDAFVMYQCADNPKADFYLGMMYEKGLGVKKSKEEAIDHYERAARDGVKKAAERLKQLQEKQSP